MRSLYGYRAPKPWATLRQWSADSGLVSPAYGHRSLADVVPSALAAMGVPGWTGPIAFDPAEKVCLFLIDGLGWRMLRANRDLAPFLAERLDHDAPATTGFPSSTAVSLTSLGTGLSPGRHGITGYTMRVTRGGPLLNCLSWTSYPDGRSLLPAFPPEIVQPEQTLFQVARQEGVDAALVTLPEHEASGLSRAAFRGGRFVPLSDSRDDVARAGAVAKALSSSARAIVYTYDSRPDTAGHTAGVTSELWRAALRSVDVATRVLAEALPAGTLLIVTADHGMVDVLPGAWIDLATEPALSEEVVMLAGDPRGRHVHARPGAAERVLGRWRDRLGEEALVLSRQEVVERGWLGDAPKAEALSRVGDAVVLPGPGVGIVDRRVAPWEATMIGHHGGLSEEEALVPLLTWRL